MSANLSAQDASAENLDALLDQTVAALRARLSGLELDEAGAVRQGDGVRVDLPVSNDAQELLDAICAPGHVEFADANGNVLLEGDAIASARAVTVTNSLGETYPAVEFHLSDEAIERYAEDAEALTGQTLSVYVDDALVSSTAVDEAITGGAGYIPFYNYSTYSQAVEASRLYAAIFASGELPLALTDAGSAKFRRRRAMAPRALPPLPCARACRHGGCIDRPLPPGRSGGRAGAGHLGAGGHLPSV